MNFLQKRQAVILAVSLIVITSLVSLLSPVFRPEAYPVEVINEIREVAPKFVTSVMDEQIREFLSVQDLLHEQAQEVVQESLQPLGALESLAVTDPHKIALGGKILVVSVGVKGSSENDSALITNAMSQMQPATQMLVQQVGQLYVGIPSLPQLTFDQVTVGINMDPSQVTEWDWMRAVSQQLVPGCNSPPSICFARYKDLFLNNYDFVVLSLHPQKKVQYPGGSGNKIGGYAYAGYLVLAGEDDYIRFGYGPQVALHELLHTFGVPHPLPSGQQGAFGYFGEPNSTEPSVMSNVQGGIVTKRVLCQAGLCDRNSNKVFDLNEASVTLGLENDIRCIGVINHPVVSSNPAFPLATVGYGDLVTVYDRVARTTLVLPIERLSRIESRACHSVSLLGKGIDVRNSTTGYTTHHCFGCYRMFMPTAIKN